MKLLYIYQYFSSPGGGTGTRAYEFSRYLVARGHKVHVITGKMEGSDIQAKGLWSHLCLDGIELTALRVGYSNRMGYWRRIISFLYFMVLSCWAGLKIKDVDLVLASSTPLTVAIPGYIISRWRRLPFVFEVRDLWPDSAQALGLLSSRLMAKLAGWLERFAYQRADRLVAISRGIKAKMVADKGVAAKKIEVIGHGADLEVFQPLGVDRSFRESMGLTGKFVAVYAGAHGWANGLELVIEAAELIQNEYQEADIAFLLVGDGREKDGLKRRAARLKLENVIFLDRHAKRDIPRILSSCDVGLMILRPAEIFTTASPNKFFEYLACGLPVLVNFPGELQETIQAHQVGLFIEPASPKALAEAVVCLRRTPEQRAKMGQEARRLAEQNFSWRERAKQLETLLVELVKGKGTPELGAYELEEADCPLCGSAGRKVLYEEEFKSRKLGIVRCGGCGLIFTTPRLSTSSRARLYGEAQLAGISRKYGWTDKVDEGQYRGFFSYCAASRLDSGRLLDVGCGSGRFLEEAGNRGWQVFGLEPAVPPFQQAKKILGDSVLNCTLNEAQFPDGHFDVTTAWGVLEHVADPVGLLKGMARVTRDGGRVVVSVPNFRYLRLKDAGIISRVVRGRRSELHPEEHLFFFTPSSLRKVFAGAGLRVERMDLASPYYLGGRLSNLLKRLAYVGAKSLFVCTGVNLAGIVYYGRKG